jgi:hypothetical protein
MSQVYSLRGSFSRNLLGFGWKNTKEDEENETGDAEVEDEQQMDESTNDEDGESSKDREDDVAESKDEMNDEKSLDESKDEVAGGESSDASQDEVTDGNSSDESQDEANDNSGSPSDEESQDGDSGPSSYKKSDSADPEDKIGELAGDGNAASEESDDEEDSEESSNDNDKSSSDGDESNDEVDFGDVDDDDLLNRMGLVGTSFDLDRDSLASSFEYSEDAIEVLDHDTGGETNIFAQKTDYISIGSGDEGPPVQVVILMGAFLIYFINRRNEARKQHSN